jgi:hypothetical protein
MKTLRLCTLDGRNPSTMSRLSKPSALRTRIGGQNCRYLGTRTRDALHRVEELSEHLSAIAQTISPLRLQNLFAGTHSRLSQVSLINMDLGRQSMRRRSVHAYSVNALCRSEQVQGLTNVVGDGPCDFRTPCERAGKLATVVIALLVLLAYLFVYWKEQRGTSEGFPQYRSVEKNSIAQKALAPFLRGTRRKRIVYSGLGSNRCPIHDRSRLSSFYDAKNQQRRIRSGIHSAV